MNASRFDQWTRTAGTGSRRSALRGLLALGAAALIGRRDVAAGTRCWACGGVRASTTAAVRTDSSVAAACVSPLASAAPAALRTPGPAHLTARLATIAQVAVVGSVRPTAVVSTRTHSGPPATPATSPIPMIADRILDAVRSAATTTPRAFATTVANPGSPDGDSPRSARHVASWLDVSETFEATVPRGALSMTARQF
jgi:hypothetical protein